MEITTTAQTILQKRYYREGETKWSDICNRVADCFGQSPRERDDFYHLMANGDFLPNSPALMNAGTSIKAYSACVSGDSMVFTQGGHVRMDQIKVGDLVLTHLGNWKKVTAHWSNGIKKVIGVRRGTTKCKSYFARFTADHKVLNKKMEWVAVEGAVDAYVPVINGTIGVDTFDLFAMYSDSYKGMVDGDSHFWKPKADGTANLQIGAFPKEIPNTPALAYIFGLYVADGDVSSECDVVRFTLNGGDEAQHTKLHDNITSVFGREVATAYSNTGNWVNIRLCGRPFARLFYDNFGKSCYNKSLPSWIYGMGEGWIRSFLDGVYSDFHERDNGTQVASLANSSIAYQLVLLARSIGYQCSFKYDVKQLGQTVPTSQIAIGVSGYADKLQKFDGGMAEVFDMEVEDDHSFVVDDFVVHNCYVLPIHDSIDSIYKFYADAAKISKSGGGIGANFSELRAEDSTVSSTGGVASGPLSFMKVQNVSTDVIKQGGRRRGANMGILDCDHPDLEKFIKIKDTKGELENFNLSVRLSDKFMEKALSSEDSYEKKVWDELCQRAWSSAEPGVLFGDTIERGNTVPHLGKLVATNPCGELPLLDYENCCLGSINLSHYVLNGNVDWDKLEDDVRTATLFLNRILDKSILPTPECQEAMEKTRKIGLGIMGLHDMLIQLYLPYDSQGARDLAASVQEFIAIASASMSAKLGEDEGLYKGYLEGKSPRRRNANLTTIAPTGTLSMIADCSSGCEPYYSVITKKTVLDGTEFVMVNKWFEVMLRGSLKNSIDIEGEIAFTRVLDAVKEAGTVMVDSVPSYLQQLFKSAGEIEPKDHVLMQAALQEYVDSSISKTINMPNNATVEDVKEVYELAYRTGCKGVTVYRDGSRAEQVLSAGPSKEVDTSFNGRTVTERDTAPCVKAELPDTLEATRYRVKVGDQKVYIIICGDKTGPKEVFAKFPYTRDTNWNTLCRSISLSLRYGIPLKEVIKQLEKSIQQINDIPSQLARILKTYLSASGVSVSSPCPECGGELIFQEGCHKCGCGYSKCG